MCSANPICPKLCPLRGLSSVVDHEAARHTPRGPKERDFTVDVEGKEGSHRRTRNKGNERLEIG